MAPANGETFRHILAGRTRGCWISAAARAILRLRWSGRAPGRLATVAAKRGAPVVGSDFVEPMLVRAREKAAARETRAMFAAADALHLPFADASFDLRDHGVRISQFGEL